MKSMYDLVIPLNQQLRGIFRDIEEGRDVEYGQTAMKDIATFLEPEMERGLIFKMNCGLYAVRFCEYCRIYRGQLHRPKVFGYDSTVDPPLLDKWYQQRDGANGKAPYPMRMMTRKIQGELRKQGLRSSLLLDSIPLKAGRYHAVECPKCGITSAWWTPDLGDATDSFDDAVIRRLKWEKENNEDGE